MYGIIVVISEKILMYESVDSKFKDGAKFVQYWNDSENSIFGGRNGDS